jgi:hypothetical protein
MGVAIYELIRFSRYDIFEMKSDNPEAPGTPIITFPYYILKGTWEGGKCITHFLLNRYGLAHKEEQRKLLSGRK